jgi:hypothetical protein
VEEQVPLLSSFGAAFVGFGRRFNKIVAVYSYQKCLDVLVKESGLSEEEAEEYMEYNVVGAYIGDQTPIFMIEVNIDDRESLQ